MKKIIIAILVLAVLIPLTVMAIGIGLTPSRFKLGTVEIGQEYPLTYFVLNTNDEEHCFVADQFYLSSYADRFKRVPEEWVTLDVSEFCIPARRYQRVNAVLKVNPETAIEHPIEGTYLTHIGGCTNSNGNVGACVAAYVKFTIE